MTDLQSLAERIEQAEGPSGALFEEAFWAVHPNYADIRSFRVLLDAKAWLDAAMTLVPNWFGGFQWAWFVTSCGEDDQPQACVTAPPENGSADYVANAATPALALCAAALRAKDAPDANT